MNIGRPASAAMATATMAPAIQPAESARDRTETRPRMRQQGFAEMQGFGLDHGGPIGAC